jgi:hypothetical protein
MTVDEWGIPILNSALQARELIEPVVKWGTRARTEEMRGTYHFYAYDFHWTALWRDPSPVPRSGCAMAVEANYSTYAGMPRAEALWGICRKRTMARAWQADGVRILVDLDVHEDFWDLMLLGVPPGWSSYATRVQADVPWSSIEAAHELACARAGRDDPLFVVFGGGKATGPLCRGRGWLWVPEHRKSVEAAMAGGEADG